jgi:uncharacterized repeat protein (TIGR01451 family)
MFQQAGSYEISGTIGQHEAGPVIGSDPSIQGGFWVIILPTKRTSEIETAPELEITTMEASDPVVLTGATTQIEYTVTVRNSGSKAATGVVVTNILPAGVLLLSATATEPVTTATRQVRWEIGTLGAPASTQLRVIVRPLLTGLYTNTASVTAAPPDSPDGNTSVQVTAVTDHPSVTYTWTGAVSTDWANRANWNPSTNVPSLGDRAIIQHATVIIRDSVTISSLMLREGATIESPATLSIVNELDWTAGVMGGSGATTLLPGGRGTISGNGQKTLDGTRVFNNHGTITWTGPGRIVFVEGTWNNTGLFDCQTDSSWTDANNPAPLVFNNSGTVRKTVATGTTSFNNVRFNNTGTLDAQSGSIELFSGEFNNSGLTRSRIATVRVNASGNSGGTFEALEPGLIALVGERILLNNGARLKGTGLHQVQNGTVEVQGDVQADRFELGSEGTLRGTGTLTIREELRWTGGVMDGSGTTTLLAGGRGTISGNPDKRLDGTRVFNNHGTITWTGAGRIVFVEGAWNNTGLFDCQTDSSWMDSNNPAPLVFNNTGTLRKSASIGVTSFGNVDLRNTGTLEIRTGTVRFENVASLGPAGSLKVWIAGTQPGAQFGRLEGAGALQLGGEFLVEVDNAFTPATGDRFEVISSPRLVEKFSKAGGLELKGGLRFDLAQNDQTVVLTAATSNRDSDGDGMSDDYELAHGLNPNLAGDANGDNDRDGHTNLEEFIAGTDPNKADSVFKLEQPKVSADAFSLSFGAVSSRTYRVERSENLREWNAVATVSGRNEPVNVRDAAALTEKNAYYRVIVSQ